MYSALRMIQKYIRYYVTADNGKGHGVHSPFVFRFIQQVLNGNITHPKFQSVEQIRKSYRANRNSLVVEDFGAGSRVLTARNRRIKDIARTSLKPRKYATLFYRMIEFYQPRHIVELGTSLGITTAYLALPGKPVYTMEGAPAIAAVAQQTFQQLQLKNIRLIQGDFDYQLPELLKELDSVDFVYIDGNHRKAPTLDYFHQLLERIHDDSILIFDDIHWSAEMESAWSEICRHPQVTATIDLFFIGIVFFRKEFLVKQHYTIRY